MRALLINPFDRTVTEAVLEGNSYQAIKALLDDNWIDGVRIGGTKDGNTVTMYVDDEGLLKGGEQQFFTLLNGNDPGILYAGKAVLTSTDREGETVALSPDVTVEAITGFVTFLGGETEARDAIAKGRIGQPKTVIHTEKNPDGDEVWRW